jgi:hypothetical protein
MTDDINDKPTPVGNDSSTHFEKSDSQPIRESAGGQLKDLVAFLAKAIVDNPDSVEVREIGGQHSTLIELRVQKSDVGMVIGKKGVTAMALRTILGAVAAKLRKKAVLEIIG